MVSLTCRGLVLSSQLVGKLLEGLWKWITVVLILLSDNLLEFGGHLVLLLCECHFQCCVQRRVKLLFPSQQCSRTGCLTAEWLFWLHKNEFSLEIMDIAAIVQCFRVFFADVGTVDLRAAFRKNNICEVGPLGCKVVL